MVINYYKILGINERSSIKEIKMAFKKNAVKYHPDKNPNEPESGNKFKKINEAYQILSKPETKIIYDLKLKDTINDRQFNNPYTHPPTNTNQYPCERSTINNQQDLKATAYAFGFIFIIAILTTSLIWTFRYIKHLEYKKIIENRKLIFEEAVHLHKIGELESSISKLNGLGKLNPDEEDIKTYKNQLLNKVLENADQAYLNGNYKNSIFFYEILARNVPNRKIIFQQELAMSYKEAEMPYKAINEFQDLLDNGYNFIIVYMYMAEIYRDNLNDLGQSIKYFEKAGKVAVEHYESIYGKAYPLFLTAKKIPASHYRLFTGIAETYLLDGQYEKAIKTTDWNLQIWKDSVSNYKIRAKCLMAQDKPQAACQFYKKAKNKNPDINIPIICDQPTISPEVRLQ